MNISKWLTFSKTCYNTEQCWKDIQYIKEKDILIEVILRKVCWKKGV